MTVLDLFDGDVTFLLERSVQTVVECNTNVILKSQFVLGENFGLYSANSLTHTSIVLLSVSLYFFAFGFIPHISPLYRMHQRSLRLSRPKTRRALSPIYKAVHLP